MKPLHGQKAFFQMKPGLPEKEPKSVEIPQSPSTSIQAPTLGVGQRASIEEQELA